MIPPIIKELDEKLYKLMMEDTRATLSTEKVAEFLEIDPMSLRDAAVKGKCPFGFGFEGKVNRYVRFFKLPLYNWMKSHSES